MEILLKHYQLFVTETKPETTEERWLRSWEKLLNGNQNVVRLLFFFFSKFIIKTHDACIDFEISLRQLYQVAIQASVEGKVIARETYVKVPLFRLPNSTWWT